MGKRLLPSNFAVSLPSRPNIDRKALTLLVASIHPPQLKPIRSLGLTALQTRSTKELFRQLRRTKETPPTQAVLNN